MLTFKNLTDAEVNKLTPLVAASQSLANVVIVVEDVEDLTTEINKALGEIGMMIFIGTPDFE